MAIALLDKFVNKFSVLYTAVNALITISNSNDPANLSTATKSSLVDAINEVNSKKLPFYVKDSSTKTYINLEV